ncbi:ATP-binding protein [Lysinibacillus sp. NPDC056185]|uniref:sensor histidine kinase n=1 Tax=Lysinibacillus sp. NPDC056185 TaxID=3345739 RepID=UPI0039EEA5FB
MSFRRKYKLFLYVSLISMPFLFLISNYLFYLFFLISNFFSKGYSIFNSGDAYPYIIILFLCIVFLYGYLSSKIIDKLTDDINNIRDVIDNIYSNSKIPVKLPVKGEDEISKLSLAINRLLDRLIYNQLKIAQQEKLRKEYMNQLSHDIRTPLSVIKTQLYYIENEKNLPQAIQKINYNINYLTKLIDHMYDETFIKQEDVDIPLIEENIQEIILESLKKWNYLFKKENITIHNNIKHLIVWKIDKLWFERILDNIFQNIVNHASDSDKIIINYVPSNGEVHECISIIDFGSGFDFEQEMRKNENTGLKIINNVSEKIGITVNYTSSNKGTQIQMFRKLI